LINFYATPAVHKSIQESGLVATAFVVVLAGMEFDSWLGLTNTFQKLCGSLIEWIKKINLQESLSSPFEHEMQQ